MRTSAARWREVRPSSAGTPGSLESCWEITPVVSAAQTCTSSSGSGPGVEQAELLRPGERGARAVRALERRLVTRPVTAATARSGARTSAAPRPGARGPSRPRRPSPRSASRGRPCPRRARGARSLPRSRSSRAGTARRTGRRGCEVAVERRRAHADPPGHLAQREGGGALLGDHLRAAATIVSVVRARRSATRPMPSSILLTPLGVNGSPVVVWTDIGSSRAAT